MKESAVRCHVECSLYDLMWRGLGMQFPAMEDPGVIARARRSEAVFREWYKNRSEDDIIQRKHVIVAPRATCKTTVEEVGLSAFIRLMDGDLGIETPRTECGDLKDDGARQYSTPYDVVLMVDPVSIEDVDNDPNWVENAWRLYKNAIAGLEKNGLIILVTSRLAEHDLFNRIKEEEPDEWTVDMTVALHYPSIWPAEKLDAVLSTDAGKAARGQLGV